MRMIMLGLDNNYIPKTPMCACIGYFDGMHKGHQALVSKTLKMANEKKCESALITFDPDPWVTIKGLKDVQHISTMRQRINKAVALGIQNVIILKFTKEVSELSPEDFIHQILGKLNLQGIVCGFDFHFGAMGKGNGQLLKDEASYDVEIVSEVDDNIGKISSTRITQYIQDGEMQKVAELLGNPFTIEGTVIHGRQEGTLIGFPTANVAYSKEYVLPKIGVYACYAYIHGKRYEAMVNLGHNPTFNYKEELSLEAFLLNYHGDLYGKSVSIAFIEYMRNEMKFKSKDNLVMQLEQDARNVSMILKKYE